MASQVKMLLDELAAVLAEMGALEDMENENEEGEAAPMSEEQEASLRSLSERADKLKERIAFQPICICRIPLPLHHRVRCLR